jgi:D-xylose transport system substrate-binding protein
MDRRHLLLAGAVAAGLISSTAAFAQSRGPVVGVSWSNFQEERWKTDEAAIKAAIEKAGGTYLSADAQSSPGKQLTDIESLIARGAKALIVLAQDAAAVRPAVEKAINEGVAVVGYDRLIEIPQVFYLTFDNVEVGRMMAREVLKAKPEGNYVFIKGSGADPNANFLFQGSMEVLKPAIDAGKIKNVGEAFTDGWLPANAQRNMEQFLTRNNNKVDAVVAANDGTAGGVVAALAAQGHGRLGARLGTGCRPGRAQPRGSWPADGDDLEGCARSWPQCRGNRHPARRWQEAERSDRRHAWNQGPNKANMTAIFLKPVPVTQANLNVVIDAGWAHEGSRLPGRPAPGNRPATDPDVAGGLRGCPLFHIWSSSFDSSG